MPRVAVVFTGGTISMRFDPVRGGNVPALDGAAILASTPGLEGIADVVPIDYGLVPASHFRFPQLFEVAGLVRDALADPSVAGAVVVQGTDTIEETAFFFDVVLSGPKPVVVTGAMRAASDAGYEGPANLRDAVRAAASPLLRDAGCVVALAGTIEPADDVIKVHTSAYTAFRSANAGRLGEIAGDQVLLARRRTRRRTLPGVTSAAEPVPLITATVSMDATILDAVAGTARGIVVEATGSGNTSPELLEGAVRAMARGVPVVVATRATAGRIAPAYAFPGGGAQWAKAGAILAGSLHPLKARILLALGLSAGLDDAGLRALFADPAPGE
jgi:L-asparaginase